MELHRPLQTETVFLMEQHILSEEQTQHQIHIQTLVLSVIHFQTLCLVAFQILCLTRCQILFLKAQATASRTACQTVFLIVFLVLCLEHSLSEIRMDSLSETLWDKHVHKVKVLGRATVFLRV